ncbi:MAG: hypothetical protein GWN84_11850 [Gammaproteobacteria bacterium]|nr:hypothetical protein [Gammaproteobacteria bacterium]NIR83561.1 hypothetical protein [Gammaproteobacteria bacterium]NIR91483.1 hypothetical protein [Gammaproteobacteria bacterium]NIU04723.1 hypothetical protein [Gammaproteobacteria bacterium]NIV51765.1 hypothetical protein [Gammaproteobacteria bacterium]
MAKQPERARIRIRNDIDLYRRAEMVTRLERQRRILSAHFEPGDPHVLIVHYERGGFSHGTLVDLIQHHGVAAEALPD